MRVPFDTLYLQCTTQSAQNLDSWCDSVTQTMMYLTVTPVFPTGVYAAAVPTVDP